jgi:uncharacterized protein (DUF2141 family)
MRSRLIRAISLIFALLPFLFTAALSSQPPDSVTLTVRIVGARNTNGVVRVALFHNREGFPGDASKAFRTQPAKIDPQTLTAQVVFTQIPEGGYAVMVFHDENQNGKLDKKVVGIPKEGYGASNNPPKKLRAPNFDEARLALSSDKTVEVRLMY